MLTLRLTLLWLGLGLCGSALAAVHVVNSTGDLANPPAGVITLRKAAALANESQRDVITFDPAVFTGANPPKILVGSRITLKRSVTIRGLGPDRVIIDGQGVTGIFYVDNSEGVPLVSISGVSLVNGSRPGGSGGAIESEGALTLSRVIFRGNDAQAGGAVHANAAALMVRDCLFFGNSAAGHGGAIRTLSGSATLVNTLFAENSGLSGGALYFGTSAAGSGLRIEGCSFVGNSTATIGGGVFASGPGSVSIRRSTFNGNVSLVGGGGMYLASSTNCLLDGVICSNNSAEFAGGLYATEMSSLTIQNTEFYANTAINGNGGGAGLVTVIATISRSIFAGNEALTGGGALAVAFSRVALAQTELSGNVAGEQGGAISVLGGSLTGRQCQLSGNRASHDGGGVFFREAEVSFVTSRFEANSAGTPVLMHSGGAIAGDETAGLLLVSGSTFLANSSSSHGGAIAITQTDPPYATEPIQIQTSFFSGNHANGRGGAIFIGSTGRVDLKGNRIVKNMAARGGGVAFRGTTGQKLLSGNRFSGNFSLTVGGGIDADHSMVTLDGGEIRDNHASSSGGGVYYIGTNTTSRRLRLGGNGTSGSPIHANVRDNLLPGWTPPVPRTSPGTYVVTNANDSGPGSLRDAIIRANAAGRPASIGFHASMPADTSIVLQSPLPVIAVDMKITGRGTEFTSIRGNNAHPIFVFDDGNPARTGKVSVANMVLAQGVSSAGRRGALIHSVESTTINTVHCGFVPPQGDPNARGDGIHVNTAGSAIILNSLCGWIRANGSGFLLRANRIDVTNCMVAGNDNGRFAGGLRLEGTGNRSAIRMTNSVVVGNESNFYGGLFAEVNPDGRLSILNTLLSTNRATVTGGGTEVRGGAISINRSLIGNNSASVLAGAAVRQARSLNMLNSTIHGNHADSFSGLYLLEIDQASLRGLRFAGNIGGNSAGALYVTLVSQLAIDGSNFFGNRGTDGGAAFFSECSARASNCRFAGNQAMQLGGAIYAREGTPANSSRLAVSNCQFVGNFAADRGGGIRALDFSQVEVSRSSFTGNHGLIGGGISVVAQAAHNTVISGSRLQANLSDGMGGGISVDSQGPLLIAQCVLTQNYADTALAGGGIRLAGTGRKVLQRTQVLSNASAGSGGGVSFATTNSVFLEGCTIRGNLADAEGGGIFNSSAIPVTLSRTLINDNSAVSFPNVQGTTN